MDYDKACFMHLTPGVAHDFQSMWVYRINLSPMHNKIPDSYSKREGVNPGNSSLSSQQMKVVYYPRTLWKNSCAEHKVTC